MQSFIASYLFQHKSICLPGLGTLRVSNLPAQSDFVNKTLLAPHPSIGYSSDCVAGEEEGFVHYFRQKQGIGWQAATEMLNNWIKETKAVLHQNGQFYLAYIGTFFQKGAQLSFTQASLPAAFLPPVNAERVIHPEADHSMLVGDKETTTAQMTEYFAGEPVSKRRWWLAALIIALLSLGLLAFQWGKTDFKGFSTGNGISITPHEMPVLHQIIP